MELHTAKVLTRDVIFSLTYMSAPFHLWYTMSLSDLGVDSESIGRMSSVLGISPAGVTKEMKLEMLAEKVAKESHLNPTIVRVPFFMLLF